VAEQTPEPQKIGVQLILADHAAVADGKLSALGAFWQVTDQITPMALMVVFQVPWTETNRRHHFSLELQTQDGSPVRVPSPTGDMQPLAIQGEFEAGRPVKWKPGLQVQIPQAINFAPIPLAADTIYVWIVRVNGEECPSGRATFFTREG